MTMALPCWRCQDESNWVAVGAALSSPLESTAISKVLGGLGVLFDINLLVVSFSIISQATWKFLEKQVFLFFWSDTCEDGLIAIICRWNSRIDRNCMLQGCKFIPFSPDDVPMMYIYDIYIYSNSSISCMLFICKCWFVWLGILNYRCTKWESLQFCSSRGPCSRKK